MAIIHVTTADEFITAIGTTAADVYVDNDIDFNGSSVSSSMAIRASTINGQNHAITNINYTWHESCFQAVDSRTVTIEDLSFTNVYTNNDKADYRFLDGGSGTLIFNRCKFQGRFYLFSMNRCRFTACAFAFEDGLGSIAFCQGSQMLFEQCYFDLKEQNTGYNQYFFYGSSASIIMQIIDCYFKGKLNNFGDNAAANSRYQGADPFMRASHVEHCVFNLDITDSRPIKFNFWDNSTYGVCIYNETKVSAPSVTATTDVTGLPNSDMQVTSAGDVERVSQAIAATGFPIVY